MGDLGLLGVFLDAKTPEQVRDKIVELLLDDTIEVDSHIRNELAQMLRGGVRGFKMTVGRTTRNRPTANTSRNYAVYRAINEARYWKRVGERNDLPMEGREEASLSDAEWKDVVDQVIGDHNADCKPDDKWTPLHNKGAQERAFEDGYETELAVERARKEAEVDD